MIKRISTLLAGIALLGTMSVSAVSTVNTNLKLKEGSNVGLYQLKAGDKFLAVEDGKLVAIEAPVSAGYLTNTLWCVTVTKENNGKAPIFDFINKGAQCFLDVTMDDFTDGEEAVLGGEVGGWANSEIFSTGIQTDMPTYSYFKSDSVVGLVVDGNSVTLKKAAANEIASAGFTGITITAPDIITLSADQINNKFGELASTQSGKITLKFTPDKNNTKIANPFNDVKFYTENAGDSTVYVYNSADSSLLYVDTAYINQSGSKFLAFNYVKKDKVAAFKSGAIANHAKFYFKYNLINDEVTIQVKSVDFGTGAKTWAVAGETTMANSLDSVNWVGVQDISTADGVRVVTISPDKVTSKIYLGLSGCAASSDMTSLADSVYTIQNAGGEYLAVPVSNCIVKKEPSRVFAQWISVEAASQNVNHMPAYQWVILKNKTNPYFANTSSVKAYNREYPFIYANVQLHKDTVNNIITATLVGDDYEAGPANEDALAEGAEGGLTFNAVPAINDSTIGYKTLSAEQLKYNTAIYSLKYFNPYVKNMFVAKNGANLTATGDSTATFAIKAIPDAIQNEQYGFGADDETAALKGRISTLATLVRTPYVMSMTGDVNVGTSNEYVSLGDSVVATKTANAVPFFFKENNHYNGEHYYALVVAAPMAETANDRYSPECLKVGVSDNTLSAMLQFQCGCESRTSAFAIGVTDQALYRHFNNKNLGEVEGRDSLKFYENVRGEYLMDENNTNLQNTSWEEANKLTIDYLGIWTADKASLNGKALGLQLDTVWVNRGLGNIKPQYIISVAHNDVAAVDTIPCDATNHQHVDKDGKPTDAMHCIHATPGHAGFEYGKYLISFADSTADVPFTDVKGGYFRLAFKKAIHITDTLIFLEDADAALAPATLSPSALIAKYTKAGYKGNGKVRSLKGDNHKNYTWAFRYTNPGMGANATEEGSANSFLIESSNFDHNDIAPENAGWVKMQNGCLCLTNQTSEFNNAKTGADGALIFNVEKLGADDMVTDAATVTASDFSVIAGEGQVTINGAAGKKVVVSNILGQTVANTVLTSDNATIAAPAGVVVVAVEGEAAVKAIVK